MTEDSEDIVQATERAAALQAAATLYAKDESATFDSILNLADRLYRVWFIGEEDDEGDGQ